MSDIFDEEEQEEVPVVKLNKKIKAVKEQIILESVDKQEDPRDTLSVYTTQELLDELYSRAHDERVKILVDKAQRNLFDLKHGANDDKVKAAFEKVYRQEVEGNIRAAKSLVK